MSRDYLQSVRSRTKAESPVFEAVDFKGDGSLLSSVMSKSKQGLNDQINDIKKSLYEPAPNRNPALPEREARGGQFFDPSTNQPYEHSPQSGTQQYEGWRDQVYTDTTGNATIGYGHKLTKDDIASGRYSGGITKAQGQALYEQDQAKHNAQLYAREPWIANLSGSQQSALQDMSFNMGPAFLDKFSGAKKNLQSGNYGAAASSFANSKYARQTGQRAQDNARKLMY